MARALVTGASGFIGDALCCRLHRENIPFHGVTRAHGDIASSDTWDQYPPAEMVVHLAGRSFVPASWDHPDDFLTANVIGTQHALDYCRRHNSSLIFVSAYIYGVPQILPIPESHPIQPTNPYALSKHLAEQLCKFSVLSDQVTNVTTLRLFNVYGPGQRPEFLIPTVLDQVARGGIVEVSDLKPRRDYIYIDDVVSAIMSAMSLGRGYNALNIGSGVSLSVEEVVETIQRLAGSALPDSMMVLVMRGIGMWA